MAVVVRDRVTKMVQAGQTEAQVVASKPTKDFDDKYGQGHPERRSIRRRLVHGTEGRRLSLAHNGLLSPARRRLQD
jgi:RNA polymerase-interacting CarD/CdnL/TRCF family regulator